MSIKEHALHHRIGGEVDNLLANGHTPAEIADALECSVRALRAQAPQTVAVCGVCGRQHCESLGHGGPMRRVAAPSGVKVRHFDLKPPAEFFHNGERYQRKNNGQSVKLSDGSWWRFDAGLEVTPAPGVRVSAPAQREAVIRAAVAAMPNCNPGVADDLIEGHAMHIEADDLVAVWQAAAGLNAPDGGQQ